MIRNMALRVVRKALDLAERVAVLFGMHVLIAEPRAAAFGLGVARAQDGVERDERESREARDRNLATDKVALK